MGKLNFQSQSREKMSGIIVIVCLLLLSLTVIGLTLLDVHITNIELVDRDLYVVVTDHGNVYVTANDILRIERTYSRSSGSGTLIEINKIYTSSGFIYLSSLDYYFSKGQAIISSLDNPIALTWDRPNITLAMLKSKVYAIGTPSHWIPIIQLLVELQSLVLMVCAGSLLVLILPIPLNAKLPPNNRLE